jgi:hypothetical protein
MFFFEAVIFFQFLVIKTLDPDWIRIGIHPKMLDPDPYQMNTDPKPWYYVLYLLAAVSIFAQRHGNKKEGTLASFRIRTKHSLFFTIPSKIVSIGTLSERDLSFDPSLSDLFGYM